MTEISLPKIAKKTLRKICLVIAVFAIATIVISSLVATSEARTYWYPSRTPHPTVTPTLSPTPTPTSAATVLTNIFQNGDFESGTSPWTLEIYDPSMQGYVGTFKQSTDAYSGVYGGLFTVTGLPQGGSGYVILLQSVSAQVGQTYTMQFYYKSTMSVRPDVYCFSSSWTRLGFFNGPALSATATWTLVTMSFGPIPSGTTHTELHFDVGSTGTFKADNVVATLSPPSPVPTVTASPTPIVTPKPTASPSPVPTVTASPTPIVTPKPTASPSPVPTVTASPTPIVTPKPTASPSPVPTVTASPTPIVTPKPTASPSPVPTVTASPTPIVTPKPTASPSPSPSPPSTQAAYTITGTEATASAIENGGSHRTTSGATVTVINTVIGWMSANQETDFLGNFAISSSITISKASITLDFTQATLTVTASTTAFDVKVSNVKFLGGLWIGATMDASAIRFYGSSVQNCLVDGVEAKNFAFSNAGGFGPIYLASGASYVTIQNCKLHDNANAYGLSLQGSGHNKVINCKIYNDRSGIYVPSESMYNEITGCEFYGCGNPDIYLDGINGGGHNTISGCNFHKESAGSGGSINIKCPYNVIFNNTFYNYPTNVAVGLSIYSQYSGAHADYNDIYGNTFTDMYYAMWIGGNPSSVQPEVGNKIHDNIFTRCVVPICLNQGTSTDVRDTWIYYNTFNSCTYFMPVVAKNVLNTVVAYNTFSSSVTNHLFETSYTNTMVYGNTGLADFNVPLSLPIPPR